MEDVVQRDSKETIHFSTDFVWWIQARKSPQFFGACFMNVNKANVPKESPNDSWWICCRCEILWLKKASNIGRRLRSSKSLQFFPFTESVTCNLQWPCAKVSLTSFKRTAQCCTMCWQPKKRYRCSSVGPVLVAIYKTLAVFVTCWVETWVKGCYTWLQSIV